MNCDHLTKLIPHHHQMQQQQQQMHNRWPAGETDADLIYLLNIDIQT
jgi:hypothetical protein